MMLPEDTDSAEIRPYDDPQRSCLEPFTNLIRELREKRHPYHVIAERLSTKGVTISWQGIQKFCHARGIVKGKCNTAPPPVEDSRRQRIVERIARRKAEKENEKVFHYEDDGMPTHTWKDEV